MARKAWLLVVVGALWTPAAGVRGDDGAAEGAGAEAVPTDTPEVIAAADVPERSTRDRAELARITRNAEPDLAVERIAEALPGFREGLSALAEDPDLEEASSLGVRELEDLQRRWMQRRDILAGWVEQVGSRAEELDAELGRIDRLEEVWEATQEAAGERDYPPALRTEIASRLREVGTARRAVSRRRDRVSALQSRMAGDMVDLDRVVNEIGEAQTEALRRLFDREDPPLWRTRRLGERDEGGSFLGSWERQRRAAAEFFEAYPHVPVLALVLWLLVGTVFIAMRRVRGSWSMSPAEAIGVKVAGDRPLAAAAVVTLFGAFVRTQGAPGAVLLLWLLAAAVLVPITLRPILGRPGVRLVMVSSVLYAIECLLYFTGGRYRWERILHVVFFFLAGSALAWAARSLRSRPGEPPTHRLVLTVIGLVVASLFGASGAITLGWTHLGRLVGAASVATVLATCIVYAVMRCGEGLIAFMVRSWPVGYMASVRNHREAVRAQLAHLLWLWGVYVWFRAALHFFRVREVVAAEATRLVEREIHVGDLAIEPLQILLFVVFVTITVWVAKVVRIVLEEDLLVHVALAKGVRETIALLAWLACLAGGMVISFAGLGIDLRGLTVLLGALGVGVGFGLQDVVKNFAAGMIILVERPIRVGDAVEVGALMGRIKQVGLRSSIIKTYQGAEVIVPNATIVSTEVVNWTLADLQRRLEVAVCVPHDEDADAVIEVLLGAASSQEGLLAYPEPAVIFLGSDDTGLRLSLRCWTEDYDRWIVLQSQLTSRVHRALRDAGIPLAVPRRIYVGEGPHLHPEPRPDPEPEPKS